MCVITNCCHYHGYFFFKKESKLITTRRQKELQNSRLWIKTRVRFTLYQLKKIRRKQKRVGWNRTVTPTGFCTFLIDGVFLGAVVPGDAADTSPTGKMKLRWRIERPWRCVACSCTTHHTTLFPRKLYPYFLHREFVRVMVVAMEPSKWGRWAGTPHWARGW